MYNTKCRHSTCAENKAEREYYRIKFKKIKKSLVHKSISYIAGWHFTWATLRLVRDGPVRVHDVLLTIIPECRLPPVL